MLERAGLRERASAWIHGFARLTLARLLIAYLAVRQLLSMVGLHTVAGHPQTVRPLIAPMSEATAAQTLGKLDDDARERVRALAAATDNVGLFFGEDVFLAFGAVLLIQGSCSCSAERPCVRPRRVWHDGQAVRRTRRAWPRLRRPYRRSGREVASLTPPISAAICAAYSESNWEFDQYRSLGSAIFGRTSLDTSRFNLYGCSVRQRAPHDIIVRLEGKEFNVFRAPKVH